MTTDDDRTRLAWYITRNYEYLFISGVSYKSVAKKLGCSPSLVSKVAKEIAEQKGDYEPCIWRGYAPPIDYSSTPQTYHEWKKLEKWLRRNEDTIKDKSSGYIARLLCCAKMRYSITAISSMRMILKIGKSC